MPKIEIGLDQEISMPDNSFVLKYFTYLKEYLSVGPPVYFVGMHSMNLDDDLIKTLCFSEQHCGADGPGN